MPRKPGKKRDLYRGGELKTRPIGDIIEDFDEDDACTREILSSWLGTDKNWSLDQILDHVHRKYGEGSRGIWLSTDRDYALVFEMSGEEHDRYDELLGKINKHHFITKEERLELEELEEQASHVDLGLKVEDMERDGAFIIMDDTQGGYLFMFPEKVARRFL